MILRSFRLYRPSAAALENLPPETRWYRLPLWSVLKDGFLVQLLLLLLASLSCCEGPAAGYLVALAGWLIGVAIIFGRRLRRPTRADVFYIQFGIFVNLLVTAWVVMVREWLR